MKSPEVSVIIPLYKEFRWLKEAVESLQACRFEDWEAILVNDGSPEDPRPVLRPFLKDSRFRYLEKKNEGSPAARNFGLRSAQGRWIAFLDQDDRMTAGRFDAQLATGRALGPEFAGIYSDYERIDESGEVIDRYVSRASPRGRFVQDALAALGLVAVGTLLIRKQWLDRAGGFDPELGGYEETDLAVRIALSGGDFAYAPGVVYQWRNHAGNTMKSPGFQEERRLRFVAKMERLSGRHPTLQALLPGFRARAWYKIGLYHAESGNWELARQWCWRAWKEDFRLWFSLYLAAKAWMKAH